jgi:hypothetical protein
MSFLKEFWLFLRTRKKFWLVPLILIFALLGILIMLTSGSAIASLIYTLF